MKQNWKKRIVGLLLSGVLLANPVLGVVAEDEVPHLEPTEVEEQGMDQLPEEPEVLDEPVELNKQNARIEFVSEEPMEYQFGEPVEPEIRVVYRKPFGREEYEISNRRYTIAYENNVAVGDNATVTVTGKEEEQCYGELKAQFTIRPKSLEGITPEVSPSKVYYNGEEQKPSVSVKIGETTLEEHVDFQVTYANNIEPSNSGEKKAEVVVEGIGNYTGRSNVAYFGLELPTTSSLKLTPVKADQIRLDWKTVAGASAYAVYRRSDPDAKYKRIATIKDPNTVTYTDTGLKTGTTYQYLIRAYRTVEGKNYYSAWSKQPKLAAQVLAPSISKISSYAYNAVKLTWKKVDKASGYAIYRSTAKDGKYTRVGTAKGNETVSFIDRKDIDCGTTYYYKMRAYHTVKDKNHYGKYSAVKSGKAILPATTIKGYGQRYQAKLGLKWEKVTGATGYAIYRSETEKGGYSRVKTIKGADTVKWTNTGLNEKKEYYYMIRAYRTVNGKNVYSAYSPVFKKTLGGWTYKNGYKLYYTKKGKLLKDVTGIIGKQSSYQIKVNKKMNTVTVYAKDGSNGYIIPVKAFICSGGNDTPIGTFATPAKYRWKALMGPSWGQWSTRITGGFLFHSVYYNSANNNMDLSVKAYNNLGKTVSHGCIRLTAGDAKWIYDNCKLKTKVTIYNSSTSGPFGKPTAYKLKASHKWDPTDPTANHKCKKLGCH